MNSFEIIEKGDEKQGVKGRKGGILSMEKKEKYPQPQVMNFNL